ncbi:hypothetical protein M2347_004166 [Chryseobacterium sp. H1D6B]|nr:hypothetical protein [Chryseobacterium sp. H1D6B]
MKVTFKNTADKNINRINTMMMMQCCMSMFRYSCG